MSQPPLTVCKQTGAGATDDACDTRKGHDAIAERGAAAIITPRKNAKPWKTVTAGAIARTEALKASKDLGRALWRPPQQHPVDAPAGQWMERPPPPEPRRDQDASCKPKVREAKLLGQSLAARDFDRQGPSPGPCCRTQQLHRARHPCHEGRGISLSGRRRYLAISRIAQQSPFQGAFGES